MYRDEDAAYDFAAEAEYLDRNEFESMIDDYDNDWPDEYEDELGDFGASNDYDGQPDEYTEWQDYYGGDDWDHGQYDHEDY